MHTIFNPIISEGFKGVFRNASIISRNVEISWFGSATPFVSTYTREGAGDIGRNILDLSLLILRSA